MQHHSAKLKELQRKEIPARIRKMLLNGASDLTSAQLKSARIVDACKNNRVLNIGARLFQKWDEDEDPTSERMVQKCRSRMVQGDPRRRNKVQRSPRRRNMVQGSPRRRARRAVQGAPRRRGAV